MSPTNGAGPLGHGVDLDLLADCLEGVLPEAQARAVLDRVANDPAWAASYTTLAQAQPAVRQVLAGYAASTGPMPADVSDQITDALRGMARPAASTASPVSLDAVRKRRAARLASNGWVRAAVAASILGVVFVGGATMLHGAQSSSNKSADTSERTGVVAGPQKYPPAPGAMTGTLAVSASGTNYTAQTLGASVHRPAAITTFGLDSSATATGKFSVSGELNRLTGPSALAACLSAIVAVHGGTPIALDYASYTGQPALIVTLAGANLVVAVADRCGLPDVGADEVGSAPLR